MKLWKKALVMILVLGTLIGIGWFGFQIEDVTVTGSEIYTDDEIRDILMDGPLSGNSIYLYMKNRFFGFKSVPFIGEVQLEWTSVSDVVVRVYEKSLVACFPCMGQYVYFDKDGIVLESSGERIGNIPLIEGIPFIQFGLHKKMDIENDNLLKRILDITQLIKHYQLGVDKIALNNKDEVTFNCGDIQVDLGDKEIYDQQIVALSSVLEKAKKKKLGGRIDLTGYTEGGDIYLTNE